MKVSPESLFPPSPASQADGAKLRSKPEVPSPVPGNASSQENGNPTKEAPPPAATQDEVKLQWDSENQIVIYQFLDQHGEVVVQVPSQQMVNLARQIEQELLKEAAAHRASGNGGGRRYDH
jgi:hypothetical protein